MQERLKEAEATRFALRQEQALESIMVAGERSRMAHAWFLERAVPHMWALRNVARSDPTEHPAEDEIPGEVLAKHRALLLELAREDEARQAANLVPKLAVQSQPEACIGCICTCTEVTRSPFLESSPN